MRELTDPSQFVEEFENAVLSEDSAAIRAVGTVAVDRLTKASGGKNALTKAAATKALHQVRGQFDAWKRENPTPALRLRQIQNQRAARERKIKRGVEMALEFRQFNEIPRA